MRLGFNMRFASHPVVLGVEVIRYCHSSHNLSEFKGFNGAWFSNEDVSS